MRRGRCRSGLLIHSPDTDPGALSLRAVIAVAATNLVSSEPDIRVFPSLDHDKALTQLRVRELRPHVTADGTEGDVRSGPIEAYLPHVPEALPIAQDLHPVEVLPTLSGVPFLRYGMSARKAARRPSLRHDDRSMSLRSVLMRKRNSLLGDVKCTTVHVIRRTRGGPVGDMLSRTQCGAPHLLDPGGGHQDLGSGDLSRLCL